MLSKMFSLLQNLRLKLTPYQLIGLLFISLIASCKQCNYLTIKSGLGLHIAKESLEGREKTIQASFYNTSQYPLPLENRYQLSIKIQDPAGCSGSSLEYMDSKGNKQQVTAPVNKLITHFIKELALAGSQGLAFNNQKNTGPKLDFMIKPGLNVQTVNVEFTIHDKDNPIALQTKSVKWIDVDQAPIKELVFNNLNDFYGGESTKFGLKNQETCAILPSDITVTLKSHNTAEFVFINQQGESVGNETTLETLLGNNNPIKPNSLTSPLQFNVLNEHGQTAALLTITLKQGQTLINSQAVTWRKEIPKEQLDLVLADLVYNPVTNTYVYTITNRGNNKTAESVWLQYSTLNTSGKLRGQAGDCLDIGPLDAKQSKSDSLALDMGNQLENTFQFILLYGKENDKEKIDEKSVTARIKFEINDLKFEPVSNKVIFAIKNTGNVNATEDMPITCSNQSKTNQARLTGSELFLKPCQAGEISTKQTFDVDFHGEKEAKFDCQLTYGTLNTKLALDKFVKQMQLSLVLEYDEDMQQITCKTTNHASFPVIKEDTITLKYYNTDKDNNTTIIPLNSPGMGEEISLQNIKAENLVNNTFQLDFKEKQEATFAFELLYRGKVIIGTKKTIHCKAPQIDYTKLELTAVYDKEKKKITYSIINNGPTIQHLTLRYAGDYNNEKSIEKEHRTGIIKDHTIEDSISTQGFDLSSEMTLRLYHDDKDTGLICKVSMKDQPKLEICGLTFDPIKEVVSFTIENSGNGAATVTNLKFILDDTAVKSNTLSTINSKEASNSQEVRFSEKSIQPKKIGRTQTFKVTAAVGNNEVSASAEIACTYLPKLEILFPENLKNNQPFLLQFRNISGFDLTKQDLEAIEFEYSPINSQRNIQNANIGSLQTEDSHTINPQTLAVLLGITQDEGITSSSYKEKMVKIVNEEDNELSTAANFILTIKNNESRKKVLKFQITTSSTPKPDK